MNRHDLHHELNGSTVMKTYEVMPTGLELSVAEFPFCLLTDGKEYVVLDEESVAACGKLPPSQAYLDRVVNVPSDACCSDLQEVREILTEVMREKMSKKVMDKLSVIKRKLEHIENNLPYAE